MIVARPMLGGDPVVLDDSYIVNFGDGRESLSVSITKKGKLDIRSQRRPIVVEPRSANIVWVSAKK